MTVKHFPKDGSGFMSMPERLYTWNEWPREKDAEMQK
jgi:hypothetical protein